MSEPKPFQWLIKTPDDETSNEFDLPLEDFNIDDEATLIFKVNDVVVPIKTISGYQLRKGDVMLYTSADGRIDPPVTVHQGLIGNVIRVVHIGSVLATGWNIRKDTRVIIVDRSPRFNEWGEDSL